MELTPVARLLLERRYLLPGETPHGLFNRVAEAVGGPARSREFFSLMASLSFLPNSPTLMNAGTSIGQLSACFVLPVEDSLEGIFRSLTHMALIHKSGGGTGFSFTHLRPRGDIVSETMGAASGPVSFMRVFDAATGAIRQGGRRRGANMGVLAASHPDIEEFVTSKQTEGLSNFNISAGIDARFLRCLETGADYELINPRDGSVWKSIDPRALWRLIATSAWASGEPGILFLDEINRRNTTPHLGPIEATNPCGEQPLYPYESCNLGSINLARCIRKHEIDEDLLTTVVRCGIDFLDAVIDVNRFPLPQIRERTLATRKIGLGIMGFAETLIRLGIPYESEEALRFAGSLMAGIQTVARERSEELGAEKGSFPAIEGSIYSGDMRNATVTTIAPTGSLHLIAGTTSGIEPIFSFAYTRTIDGQQVSIISDLVRELLPKTVGGRDVAAHVRRYGTVEGLPLAAHIRDLFKTAIEIAPEHHVRMQAAFQEHVDNAVSKTVNLPNTATAEDIAHIFSLAHDLGCKGITVYRYQSRPDQVLSRGCDVCIIDE
ncbi:MAG TPA: adenosylcobalamin-dependent ribonucleoside-diphosphate reductase [Candidatus Methanoculleus thermohydrogenotrophicum]|jgi:ribonucleoside-diphosphate reductase alpha chain|nr:adenosylcobalamin-dependent ribonucleoside-diphosphate reductase [Candidatus Methanoculleus thermohydrogenotrophicum]NLM81397.1 adenosylcobalamin-dependent ribonucleoside-diphosphate reductase [Candidatus Methanoculleus thermohydrogenotrophicum]HOB17783.1 adenosylcobalamin-dependent ribonucleoside-diphosphate reductase [Candidatus Methanoculleus thermohydrogenotrophicum]HPZ37968.1 adenosylcobalamin-dependent ribonucleoside-diphosphate reductase [Candidatus Methanoculleus thermohydrogenotrophi